MTIKEFADCYDENSCTFVSFEEYQKNKQL